MRCKPLVTQSNGVWSIQSSRLQQERLFTNGVDKKLEINLGSDLIDRRDPRQIVPSRHHHLQSFAMQDIPAPLRLEAKLNHCQYSCSGVVIGSSALMSKLKNARTTARNRAQVPSCYLASFNFSYLAISFLCTHYSDLNKASISSSIIPL
jgi:hypothetical protein